MISAKQVLVFSCIPKLDATRTETLLERLKAEGIRYGLASETVENALQDEFDVVVVVEPANEATWFEAGRLGGKYDLPVVYWIIPEEINEWPTGRRNPDFPGRTYMCKDLDEVMQVFYGNIV